MKKNLFALAALLATCPLFAATTFPEATFPEATFPEASAAQDVDGYLQQANSKATDKTKLTLRVEIGFQKVFEAGEGYSASSNQMTTCGAILHKVTGTQLQLVVDEPCAKAVRTGFTDKDSVQDVTFTLYFEKLGKYTSGADKGAAFFYVGRLKPAQLKTVDGLNILTVGLRQGSELTAALHKLQVPAVTADNAKKTFKTLNYTSFRELPSGECECSKAELLKTSKRMTAIK